MTGAQGGIANTTHVSYLETTASKSRASRINSAIVQSLSLPPEDAVGAAMEAGNLLLEQRQSIGDGDWEQWLAANCPSLSAKTAWRLERAASYMREMVSVLDELTPVADRINAAYTRTLSSAIDAVTAAVEAGDLLFEEKEKMEHGEWGKWLEVNCPKITVRTAQRLMKAAAYVRVTGYFEAQTVRQLYLEAGAIEETEGGDGSPSPEQSIMAPAMMVFNRFRLFYNDELLAKLKPVAVPQLLGYVRDIRQELNSLEERLMKRMPAGEGGEGRGQRTEVAVASGK